MNEFDNGFSVSAALTRNADGLRHFIRERLAWFDTHRLNSDDLVDDVLQDTWVAAIRASGRVRFPDELYLQHWLRTIAWRKVLTYVRTAETLKRGRAESHLPQGGTPLREVLNSVPSQAMSPLSALALEEIRGKLRTIVDRLPEDQRAAVAEHFAGFHTLREISAHFRIPLSSLFRLIEAIRREFAPEATRHEQDSFR